MAKIAVSVRMEEAIHGEFKRWADEDRRSLGNYLEALFMQERERRVHGDVTLAVLNEKLDRLLAKSKSSSQKKDSVVTSEEEFVLPEYVDEEIWNDFVQHRKEIKKPLTKSTLKYELRCMEQAHANGWDIDGLLEKAIQKGWRGWFFDEQKEENPDREDDVGEEEMTDEEIAMEKQAKLEAYHKKLKEEDERRAKELADRIQDNKDRMRAPKNTPSKGWFTLEVWDQFVDRVYAQVYVYVDLQRVLNNVTKKILELDNGVEWNDRILLNEMARDKIAITNGQLDVLLGDY